MIAALALAVALQAKPSPNDDMALVCGTVTRITKTDKQLVFDLQAAVIANMTARRMSFEPKPAHWIFTVDTFRLSPGDFDRDYFKPGSVAIVRVYLPKDPCADPCKSFGYTVLNRQLPPTGFMGSSGTAPPPGMPPPRPMVVGDCPHGAMD